MKLLQRFAAYWSSRWSARPPDTLTCAEQQLEALRHQAESLARGRWM